MVKSNIKRSVSRIDIRKEIVDILLVLQSKAKQLAEINKSNTISINNFRDDEFVELSDSDLISTAIRAHRQFNMQDVNFLDFESTELYLDILLADTSILKNLYLTEKQIDC